MPSIMIYAVHLLKIFHSEKCDKFDNEMIFDEIPSDDYNYNVQSDWFDSTVELWWHIFENVLIYTSIILWLL